MDMPIARNGAALAMEMMAPVSKVGNGDPAMTLKYSSTPSRSTKPPHYERENEKRAK